LLHPICYAEELRKKVDTHKPQQWLVNTGYDRNGQRISIQDTRAIISAIVNNQLNDRGYDTDDLGYKVPKQVPGVDSTRLIASNMWDDTEAFRKAARSYVTARVTNFNQYKGMVPVEVFNAGPHLQNR
jgi:phosphoenolpyruvate carboxykinase (ATP)